jgi:hypothetical protein
MAWSRATIARLIEAPHMGITRGEGPVGGGKARMILDSHHQLRHRFVKPMLEEIGQPHRGERLPHLH